MPRLVPARLAVMMFLFYFALGAWIVTLSTFLMSAPTRGGLNFTTAAGRAGSTRRSPFGGLLAPLLVGLLADRLFAAERVLGVSACSRPGCCSPPAGGATPTSRGSTTPTAPRGGRRAGRPLDPPARSDRVNDDPEVRRGRAPTRSARCSALMLGVLPSACSWRSRSPPCMALRNLPDPGTAFGRVRLFGTVGWIAAGFAVGAAARARSRPKPLYLAAAGRLRRSGCSRSRSRTPRRRGRPARSPRCSGCRP